ncbi:MAG: PEP-CTERM sorting domain-containing protein [Armatimonadetes bacterium]|nr:PEP-CTERM sorting domain-containing protein [Armatimonadota bacterium]
MITSTLVRRCRIGGLAAGLWLAALPVFGQIGYNVDFNHPNAPPEAGGGVPSSAFGAAGDQVGFWNGIPIIRSGEFPLYDLNGMLTSARLTVTGVSTGIAFRNPSNTGDHAKLLNDGNEITDLDTYTFTGLLPGPYRVFTYAVPPQGYEAPATITVVNSTSPNPQVVTGPMPGNRFELLITHADHRATVGQDGVLTVIAEYYEAFPDTYVNGIQVVVVPEPGTLAGLGFGAVLAWLARRRRR